MSFDVPKHRHAPIEIYGDKGSILVPDPNRFGGEVQVAKPAGSGRRCRSPTVTSTASSARSASPTWRPRSSTNRPHRASGALALHVLEVMEAFQTSADEGRRVKIESRVERPAMMPAGRDTGQID